MLALLFVLVGFLVGTLGTMIGAGGGFVVVPILLLGFHFPHQLAVGTSLVVVFFNALSGSISYLRQGLVDIRAGISFAVATLPGAVLGVYVLSYFSGPAFSLSFGILLMLISIFLFIRPEKKQLATENKQRSEKGLVQRKLQTRSGHTHEYSYHHWGGVAFSSVVGFLSSLLGIGGGIIHVPALIQLFSFPAHVATATSHFVLAISAFVGAVLHYQNGDVDLSVAVPMSLGVVVGAQLGAVLAKKVHGTVLVRLLSSALFVVGLRLLFSR